jgi:hypothetical protein
MTVLELAEHPEFAALVTKLRSGDVLEIVDHGRPVCRWLVSEVTAVPPVAANPWLQRLSAFRQRFPRCTGRSDVLEMRAEDER